MSRLVIALCLGALVAGCGSVRNGWVNVRQNWTMLACKITLYDSRGDTLRTWSTHAKVETNGGEAWWVDDGGTQWHIAGTFVVEGK